MSVHSAGDSKRPVDQRPAYQEMSLGGASGALKATSQRSIQRPIHERDSLASGRTLEMPHDSQSGCLSCIGSFFVSCWDVIVSFFSALFCCSSSSAEGRSEIRREERKEGAERGSAAAASSQSSRDSSGEAARAFYLKYHARKEPCTTLRRDVAALPEALKARIPSGQFTDKTYQDLWDNNTMGSPALIAEIFKPSLVEECSKQMLGKIEYFIRLEEVCSYALDYDGRTTGQQAMLKSWRASLQKEIFKKSSDPIEQAVLYDIKCWILGQLRLSDQVNLQYASVAQGQPEAIDAFILNQSVANVENRNHSVDGLKSWVEHVKGIDQRKVEMEELLKKRKENERVRAQEAQAAFEVVSSGQFAARMTLLQEMRALWAVDSIEPKTQAEREELQANWRRAMEGLSPAAKKMIEDAQVNFSATSGIAPEETRKQILENAPLITFDHSGRPRGMWMFTINTWLREESQELQFILLGAFVSKISTSAEFELSFSGTLESWKRDLRLMSELEEDFFSAFQSDFCQAIEGSYMSRPYSWDRGPEYEATVAAWQRRYAEISEWVLADAQFGHKGILRSLNSIYTSRSESRAETAERAAKSAADSKESKTS